MILKLAYYGDSILRKKCALVEAITPEISVLIQDMIETMHSQKGLGIAAPQVHADKAIFVICPHYKDEEGNWHPGDVQVFINPKILEKSEETTTESEGCLSIPKIYGDVKRPQRIVIQAMNEKGETFTKEFTDFEAHIVLHENDHINGVLFIDRLSAPEKKQIEHKLRDLKKRLSKLS
jgi:peptide deformylase